MLFEIRKYNGPHTCTESTFTQDHEQLNTHVIEKELRDVVKNDPTIKIASLQQTLYNKYQYRPSYFKVWEAKEKEKKLTLTKNLRSLVVHTEAK